MKIEVKHLFTNKMVSRDIDVTEEQLDRWDAGEPIQNVMPHLSADDREFLMTGISSVEWDEMSKNS